MEYCAPIQAAAPSFGLKVVPASVRSTGEIERAVEGDCARIGRRVARGAGPRHCRQSRAYHWACGSAPYPVCLSVPYFVASGGLISYGTVPTDQYRQAALYVDHILKGANPGELPVSNRLGLSCRQPQDREDNRTYNSGIVLARADEVIE